MTQLALIWAQARGGVIGLGGDLPWRLPEDLAHFKSLTIGHPVIMGRRTWESLPPRFRPLDGRRNVVVTRTPGFVAEGAEVAGSVVSALDLVRDDALAWGIGGGSIYRELLPRASRLEVTEIDLDVEGDTYAPVIGAEWQAEPSAWLESSTGLTYRFVTYLRG
jgi:dihydrofolate reductase